MNAAGVVQATPWNTPGLENNGAGELVCADAGARQAGCVPVNIYGEGNVTQEAVDYMKIGTINGETAETKMASLIFTNPNLWDLWGAGPIGLAVGAEWREEYGSQPDRRVPGLRRRGGLQPVRPDRRQLSTWRSCVRKSPCRC